jgi:hypothetical protein
LLFGDKNLAREDINAKMKLGKCIDVIERS